MILLAIGKLAVAIASSNDGRIIAAEIGGMMQLHATPIVFATHAAAWLVRSQSFETPLPALLLLQLFFSHANSPFK